ncbi:glutathione S-transferase family protein [Chamaesiphon minutus]|uniref:Glutathione S-transferase n=1 Tax=Chamaesiphon minutus (strain ATCC 27169 / PCC 6605) TaxID=1173020 RepID=K9UDB3_CHAP6|nr:glutathione S-transferase family protein [Chamaesiphon minutus]AFY92643.1 glutathione S-transferase [Chamaesiphon minutus PCC 6605]
MKFYYDPASSYCQRVAIALYEKDIPFTPIKVSLFDPEAREQYQKINPFAKIPTLETDNGEIFFEACIIIEYLDRQFPQQPCLLNPERILEIRTIERIIDVYINSSREVLFADSQRELELRGKKEVIKASRLLEIACSLLEDRLQDRTWLVGEQFSLADCTAAPTLTYLRLVYDYRHLPNLTNYMKRLESRASVARVQREGRIRMNQMLASLAYPLKLAPLAVAR